MKIKFSKLVKVLLSMTAVFFVVGFSGLFFPEIEAKVTEARTLTFRQQGHQGVLYSDFQGSTTSLLLANYEYEVKSIKYSSWGLANGYSDKTIVVKYFPLFPSLSITSTTPYFIIGFFLLFMSFGIRTFIVWCKKIAYRYN